MKYADVIVNVDTASLDRSLQYEIGDVDVETGMRVIVPLGSRQVEGIVIGICADKSHDSLKRIISVTDDVALSDELLGLASWLRQNYACRWVDALRTVCPPHTFGVKLKRVTIGQLPERELSVREQKIVDYIKEKGTTAVARLERELDGDVRSVVNALVRSGVLEEVAGSGKTGARTRRVFLISDQGRKGLDEGLLDRAFRQKQVLTELGCSEGTVDQISSRLDVNRDAVYRALRELLNSGYVDCVDRVWEREVAVHRVEEALSCVEQLTDEQRTAVNAINEAIVGDGGSFLVHGITSSGKTQVYLEAMECALEHGHPVIFLVPEIALTPQLLNTVVDRIGPDKLAIIHSRLSPGERYDQWHKIQRGKAQVVVGARSAVFAPVKGKPLIIMDEEHESSYKQEEMPHYHARAVAEKRTEHGGVLVMGSATPAIETYYRARCGQCSMLTLGQRIGYRPLPDIDVIDMRPELKAGHKLVFSRRLMQLLTETIERGEQAILFINRRGHSTFVLCGDCGFVATCPHCEVPMVHHMRDNRLRCHWCSHREDIPGVCPRCKGVRIKGFGVGTERIEAEFTRLWPDVNYVRMDMDATRKKHAHTRLWSEFVQAKAQVLIGTQMVAKGWDVPGVTTVGVISADVALNLPDFRASERTLQLLMQVAGRAGRGKDRGRVVFQTYNPEHYAIEAAARQDYKSFYEKEIAVREQLGYPPYSQLVLVEVSGKVLQHVEKRADELATDLGQYCEVLGPAPAPRPKRGPVHRWQFLLFCQRAADMSSRLLEVAGEQGGVRVQVNVDPVAMM